jgi:hypothetical protein
MDLSIRARGVREHGSYLRVRHTDTNKNSDGYDHTDENPNCHDHANGDGNSNNDTNPDSHADCNRLSDPFDLTDPHTYPFTNSDESPNIRGYNHYMRYAKRRTG